MKIKYLKPMAVIVLRRVLVEIGYKLMRKGYIKPQQANRAMIQHSLAIQAAIYESTQYGDEMIA